MWPSWAYVQGERVDYLSPTLFLTDIFIIALFLLASVAFVRSLKWWHIAGVICLSAGIILSQNPNAGWYGLLKLGEFVFVGWYISQNAVVVWKLLQKVLPVGLIVESILGIWQFVLQHSVGGLWYMLGERTFYASTPGIANASLNGSLVLRPYATFPHPNVFAGFLLIGLVFLGLQFSLQTKLGKIFYVTAFLLGCMALLVTLSRSAIALGVSIGLVCVSARFSGKTKLLQAKIIFACLLALGIVGFLLVPRFTGINVTGESVVLREQLMQAAWHMFVGTPLLGVGLNNFFIHLPKIAPTLPLQPVHNIYLLVLSQAGMAGFVLFVYGLVQTFKRLTQLSFADHLRKNIRTFTFITLGIVLGIGFVDHYFFTLQQGQLLTALIFGFAWQAQEKPLQ